MLQAIADERPGWVLHKAKMALEIHPEGVSKATAVTAFLAGTWPRRVPFAAGDDATDEGMMAVAQAAGGYAVKVGEGESCAGLRVATSTDLVNLLTAWLDRTGIAS